MTEIWLNKYFSQILKMLDFLEKVQIWRKWTKTPGQETQQWSQNKLKIICLPFLFQTITISINLRNYNVAYLIFIFPFFKIP